MGGIAAHAAAPPLGEYDVSLLVGDELGAGSRHIGQDGVADHVRLSIGPVHSHGFPVGVEVESSGGVQLGVVIGFDESLVEHLGPDGWGHLGQRCYDEQGDD